MHFMWVSWGNRAKNDDKFIQNINDVVICLICCVVEHRLRVFISQGDQKGAIYDNKCRGKAHSAGI